MLELSPVWKAFVKMIVSISLLFWPETLVCANILLLFKKLHATFRLYQLDHRNEVVNEKNSAHLMRKLILKKIVNLPC